MRPLYPNDITACQWTSQLHKKYTTKLCVRAMYVTSRNKGQAYACVKPCSVKLRSVTHDTRLAACDSDIIRYTQFSCMCSVRREKRQVARDGSPATFGIATCSDRWRYFLEVARHCDITCTKYRSVTWMLRCPSLRIAISIKTDMWDIYVTLLNELSAFGKTFKQQIVNSSPKYCNSQRGTSPNWS